MSKVYLIEPETVESAARRVAGWIRSQGLHPGDRVAILARNDPHLLSLTHGALRTGVVPVLIDPGLPSVERDWILADADPHLVLTDLRIDELDAAPADLAPAPLARPMHYTSGTTGRPKGVWTGVLSEELAAELALDEQDLWEPAAGATFLLCSPLHHSVAHRAATAALLGGCRVLFVDGFDARTVASLLASGEVQGAFLVPTHLRRLFALDDLPGLAGLTRILHAGEPCPQALKRQALSWFPPGTVWEFYGSTEGQFTLIGPDEWLSHPGSVGKARLGRRLTIGQPDLEGVGTVYVSAPSFARWEYWGDQDRTASAWQGDSFTVGDLGRIDEDGYLFLLSRREDLIISGGVNVYPAEVERILLEHPAVSEAAVFGVPDPEWGQRVCAAIVTSFQDRSSLRAWMDERLTRAQSPKDLAFVREIPRSATGKIKRSLLRSLFR